MPHGALDGELARTALSPRFGRWAWFPAFAAPYLALTALILVAWQVAPLTTLALFLLVSAWHFGTEEAEGAPVLEKLVRGGLPIAVPVLVHPAGTATIFATVAGVSFTQPPSWLWVGAIAWLAAAIVWAGTTWREGCRDALAMPAILVGVFAALPPLTAFAIYFVCIHAPLHVEAAIRDCVRTPRVRDWPSAARLALPLTMLTILIGVALWPLYVGPAPSRLLALTIQGLAALTVPHLALEICVERLARPRRHSGGGREAPRGSH